MTSRDKKLLMVLGVMFVLLIYYYAVYKPLDNKQNSLEIEISTLQGELNILDMEYIKKDRYLEEIEAAKARIEEIDEVLPSDLEQERAYKLLFDIEDTFETIHFGNVAFSEMETIGYSNEANDETTEVGLRRTMTTQINTDYGTLKDFMRFIYEYPERVVLTGLSMSVDEETGGIGTNLFLNQYGLFSASRPYEPVEINEVPVGNPVPFKSVTGNVAVVTETVNNRDTVEDVFVIISPTTSDDFAQVIGLGKDATQTTYVKTDENALVTGSIEISQDGDTYYASYSLNGIQSGRRSFVADEFLEIRVYSSNRVGDNDNSAMNLTIKNTTNQVVTVSYASEDRNNPRLNIVATEGNVVIK